MSIRLSIRGDALNVHVRRVTANLPARETYLAESAVAAVACGRHAVAFTFIELIVVFGIVTIPIDVFMPTLTARPSACDAAACQSDMRQVARLLLGCANMFIGFVFP